MLKNQKMVFAIAYSAFAAVNLVTFLFLFIPYYVLETDIGYLEYVRLFFGKLVEFTLPPIAATLIFLSSSEGNCGRLSRAVKALGFASTRIIYLVPYYYLYFIAYGYDTTESIWRALLVTLFGVTLFFAVVYVMCVLMRELPVYVVARTASGESKAEKRDAARAIYAEKISERGTFDLGKPVILGIFASCFLQFALELIKESADTVSYLIDYAGMYRTSEIIYITGSFVFLLVELMATHAFCCFLKNKLYCDKTNIEEIKE